MSEDMEKNDVLAEEQTSNTDVKKPTDEEIKEFEKEYLSLVDEYKEKYSAETNYLIGEEKDGEKILKVLTEFNNVHLVWTKDLWQGVLSFDKELSEAAKNIKEGLRISAPAISYLFYIISQPTCKGLESAKWFNDNVMTIKDVFETTQAFLQEQQEFLKKVNIAKDRLAAGVQGFYYEPENTGEIEYENAKKCTHETCDCAEKCEDCKCK